MTRRLNYALAVLGVFALACPAFAAAAKPPEIIDPAEAAKDPDFAVQGEYVGEKKLPGEQPSRVGVQVIARGNGEFEAFVLGGGLPGQGWEKGKPRIRLEGKRQGKVCSLRGKEGNGELVCEIAGGEGLVTGGGAKAKLKRVERKSPTLGEKPPAGAVVLFDGSGLERFEKDAHLSPDGNLLSGTTTVDKFNSCQIHVEFRLSWIPQARGQGRSNSGVYVYDCYEIQVLDSFGLTGENNECGGFYSIKEPTVNMCFPPMAWQTYDIDFTAPKFDADGKKTANAQITLRHNGVVIHDMELPKGTPGRKPEGPGPRALHLQGHGNKVQYRNLWVVPKNEKQ
jgi:hypothetical protein